MVKTAKIATALVAVSAAMTCMSTDQSGFARKNMPDLYYVYLADQEPAVHIDVSIARALEFFSSDPAVFSDPVGIIDIIPDSLDSFRLVRNCGIILSDRDWIPPDSVVKKKIDGGSALTMTYNQGFGKLDSCWNEMLSYARNNKYELIPPGIEIYRGYESETPDATTELIIKIK